MPRRRILHVFNRYVFMGGEEVSVNRIYEHAQADFDVDRCFIESSDWVGPNAPGKFTQLRRTWYNHDSARRLHAKIDTFKPDAMLFHNVFPVGSPSLFHVAHQRRVPVMYYIHNFRPFSVGGTLYVKGRMLDEALHGHYGREIMLGAWQESRLKTAVMALVLKRLHHSGWLNSVKAWICISEFLRERFIEAGVPAADAFVSRHSWDAMPEAPPPEDAHAYLFLARLVEVKGVELMLNGWHEITAKLGQAAPDLWVCGEGPLEPMVRKAAAANPKIRFHGLVEGRQKNDLLRRCRAMLAPSVWHEPLGLVTYEAYDFAKPVLAAASGGLMETVFPGATGDIYKRDDQQAFVEAVLRFEALPAEERLRRGRAGREWLLANTRVTDWRQRFSAIADHAIAAMRSD